MTGLFKHHTAAQGRGFRGKRGANGTVLNQFAELLAEGMSPADAAERMGKRREYGNTLLQRIRQQLGPQAR